MLESQGFARFEASTRKFQVALLAGCVMAWSPSAAFAQDAAKADAEGAETSDIIVTAQFRETRLQDTPLAITAISGELLTQRSQTNLAEVATQAPNVTLIAQSPSFGPALGASIRGIGQFDFNPAFEPGVGIYVDDVYYPTITGAIFDLLDLDRVEILRGPQGTLSGKNSIGGSIKLYSRLPDATPSADISATYGSRNRMDLRASLNMPIADDLFLRVSGVSKRQRGYLKRLDWGCLNPGSSVAATTSTRDCIVAHDGGANYQAVRGQLRYAGDRVDINITADYTDEDRTQSAQVLTYIAPNPPTFGDVNPFGPDMAFDNRFLTPFGEYYGYSTFVNGADGPLPERRARDRVKYSSFGVSGRARIEISDSLSLTSITAYRDYTTQFGLDGDFSPMARGINDNDLRFDAFSQELRLNGEFGSGLVEYTIGGFYTENSTDFNYLLDARSFGLTFFAADVVESESLAAFAHVKVNLTDALSFSGGVRYNDEKKSYEFNRKNPNGTPNSVLDGQTFTYDGSKLDYSANLQYRLSDELMVYAQTSTGIKGGGISPRPFTPPQARPFGPETVTSYEIGAKSDLFDRLLRLNVAAFRAYYKDAQFTLASCPEYGPAPGCGVTANAGDGRMTGFELEASIRPADGFSVDASLSYIDFEWTDISPAVGGPTRPAGVQYGHKRPFTPNWKWSLGAQYEIDLDDSGSFTPRFDVGYQGSFFSTLNNTPVSFVDSYTLANARITWRNVARDFSVSGEVLNLFDKYYYTNAFDQMGCCGQVDSTIGRPREFAVTVRKMF